MQLNGINTQGENIADNGGIKEAYLAYSKLLTRLGNEEPKLPGINLTGRQLFWVSAANVWCSKIRKETIEQVVVTDEHALDPYRVIVPFSNMDEFAKDYNCPIGSKMNPKNKCHFW